MSREEIIENLTRLKYGIDILNSFISKEDQDKEDIETINNTINLINKQDQIIDRMAEHIVELQNQLFDLNMLKEYKFATTKEDIIKYYKGV